MENCTHLIPIDSKKIRKKAIRELNSTFKKIETAKSNINLYFNESKPAFQKWLENTCGTLIQKINQLEEKYRKRELEVQEVFAYSEFYRISPAAAYARIQARKNTPENEREYDPFYDGSKVFEEEEDFWEENKDYEDFKNYYYSNKNPFHAENSEERDRKLQEELSIIFHKIANLLHPDKNPNLTQEEQEKWVESLQYYKEKNLIALKNILTWMIIRKNDPNQEASVYEIKSLNKKMKAELKSLQKKIRSFKKSPDWNFQNKTSKELKQIQKVMEENLQSEYILIHIKMEKLNELIFSWKEYLRFTSKNYY